MSNLLKKLKVIGRCRSFSWDTYRSLILKCNNGELSWINLRYDDKMKIKFDYDIYKDINNQNTWSTMQHLFNVEVNENLIVKIECWSDEGKMIYHDGKRWSGEIQINESLLSLFSQYIEKSFESHVKAVYEKDEELKYLNRLKQIEDILLQ